MSGKVIVSQKLYNLVEGVWKEKTKEFPGLEEGLMALQGQFAEKLKENCDVRPDSEKVAELRHTVQELSRKVAGLRETAPGQIAAKQAEAEDRRLLAMQKKVLGMHPVTADIDPTAITGAGADVAAAESLDQADANKGLEEQHQKQIAMCEDALGNAEDTVPKLMERISDAKKKTEAEIFNGQNLYSVLEQDQVGGGKGAEVDDAKRVAKRKVAQGLVDRGNKRR